MGIAPGKHCSRLVLAWLACLDGSETFPSHVKSISQHRGTGHGAHVNFMRPVWPLLLWLKPNAVGIELRNNGSFALSTLAAKAYELVKKHRLCGTETMCQDTCNVAGGDDPACCAAAKSNLVPLAMCIDQNQRMSTSVFKACLGATLDQQRRNADVVAPELKLLHDGNLDAATFIQITCIQSDSHAN